MDANPELERLFAMECKKHKYYVQSKHGYDVNVGDEVQIVNENNPFMKNRTILNKDPYRVTKRLGNIYELNSKTYRPRYLIKKYLNANQIYECYWKS